MDEIGPAMALAWCIGTMVCVVGLLYLYSAMSGEKEINISYSAGDGCLHCDDGMCTHCRERVRRSIARRDLLTHTKDCHYRETLGTGPCSCKEE